MNRPSIAPICGKLSRNHAPSKAGGIGLVTSRPIVMMP